MTTDTTTTTQNSDRGLLIVIIVLAAMMQFLLMAVAALGLIVAVQYDAAHDIDVVPATKIVTVSEDYGHTFYANPGDQLNLIMTPNAQVGDLTGMVERCLNYGGEPIYDPETTIMVCEDSDF